MRRAGDPSLAETRGQAHGARPVCNPQSALNQLATFDQQQRRTDNEGRRSLFEQVPLVAFVCECPLERCGDTVTLSAADYDARRPGLIIADGHVRRRA